MHEILNSDLVLIISFVATILSLLISVFQIKKCVPCYAKMTKCLINKVNPEKFSELSIFFNDKKINQISITTFAFWNSGKIKLKTEDYGNSIPYIEIENGNILDFRIRCTYNEDFFKLEPKPYVDSTKTKLYTNFNGAIGKNQGFVIDIIHSGTQNDDVFVRMNFNDIKLKRVFLFNKRKIGFFDMLSRLLLWISAILILSIFLIAAFYNRQILPFVDFLIITLSVFWLLWKDIVEMLIPYKNVPKKFREYFREIDD